MYRVLLSRPDDLLPEKISRTLAAFRQIPLFDARRQAKQCWGFLGENLPEAEARRLSDLAAQNGLDTIILEEAVVLPDAKVVHMARTTDQGLSFAVGSSAQETVLPWENVRLVAAIGLREEVTVQKKVHEGPTNQQRMVNLGISLATGIPLGLGKGKDVVKNVKGAEFFLYMDIFVKDAGGVLIRLHINAQEFNFSSLGTRIVANVLGNYKTFLEDLVRVAGGLRNKGARTLLAGQPFANAGYESRDDYEKECRWLLTLAHS